MTVAVSIKYQFGSQNETRRRERTNVPTCAYTFSFRYVIILVTFGITNFIEFV